MRAFHQKKTAEKDGSPLRLALLALALTVTMELFNHKAFSEGPAAFWAFLAKRPLAAAVDYLLVLLTLLPTLFARRRTFWQTLLSVVWLGVGAANGFILLNRMTPFTIADLTVLNTGLDTLPNYLSPGYILLLAAAVAAALAGLTVLFWKGKRCPLPWKQRAKAGLLSTAAAAAALAGTWALAFHTHQLSAEFANLAYAYEDYGLPYCFLQTWLNKGIRCPAGYSSAAMDRVAGMIGEETPVNMGEPQTDVNVVFVQLESFIDPAEIQGLELSRNAAPNWTALTEQYSSGYLTVPVVGAGTANTECEVLTGMSTRLFGPGEYPYQTCLLDQTVESVAYDLKANGYGTHAIHDHSAATRCMPTWALMTSPPWNTCRKRRPPPKTGPRTASSPARSSRPWMPRRVGRTWCSPFPFRATASTPRSLFWKTRRCGCWPARTRSAVTRWNIT